MRMVAGDFLACMEHHCEQSYHKILTLRLIHGGFCMISQNLPFNLLDVQFRGCVCTTATTSCTCRALECLYPPMLCVLWTPSSPCQKSFLSFKFHFQFTFPCLVGTSCVLCALPTFVRVIIVPRNFCFHFISQHHSLCIFLLQVMNCCFAWPTLYSTKHACIMNHRPKANKKGQRTLDCKLSSFNLISTINVTWL